MKKTLLIFLGLTLLLPTMASIAKADQYGDFTYSSNSNGVTITGYADPGGAATIPSTIPGVGTVTSIGNHAFDSCTSLTSVTIPKGVTSIGEYAFLRCTSLTSVTFPDSVRLIGRAAFSHNIGLTNVTIPNSVESIGDLAFVSCASLTAIEVDTSNTNYSSFNGVLFDKNQSTLVQYPGGLAGAYAIPSSVTSIEGYAFRSCSKLTSVTIPNSVTSIGYDAFDSCTSLTSVTIPNGVTSLVESTFSGCTGLTRVSIPNSVASIGHGAFSGCTSLTIVTVPNSVTIIENSVFSGCTSLASVFIPSSVTIIGGDAFSGCTGLISVTIPSSVSLIGPFAFRLCTSLTNAFFQGDAPTTFGGYAFYGTPSGFTIYYPSTASGWSTPTWNGYAAKPYYYLPLEQRPVASLVPRSGTVAPMFTRLQRGTNYQLQVSSDLTNWNNSGAVFAATNASQAYSQPFDTTNACLFFRLQAK